jgi:hypothetical protein
MSAATHEVIEAEDLIGHAIDEAAETGSKVTFNQLVQNATQRWVGKLPEGRMSDQDKYRDECPQYFSTLMAANN